MKRRTLAAVTGLALAAALGGCAATGIFHDQPDEKTPQPAYPEIGDLPPARPTPAMTEEEQAEAEAELKGLAASRQRTMQRKLETQR